MLPSLQQIPHDTKAPEDPTLPTPEIFAHTSSGQSLTRLLRLLGVVLAFGGGIGLGYALPIMALNSDVLLWVSVIGLVIWAALAASLFQSFWAVFLVPVISVIGLFVGSSLQNYGFDMQAWFTSGLGDIDIVVLFIVLPWMVGAFIGTPLGMWVEQRIRR